MLLSADEMDPVTENLTWEPHTTPKWTQKYLRRVEEQRRSGENAKWCVNPKQDPLTPTGGVVGLHPRWEKQSGEVGIWLREQLWGNGYAGEALDRLLPIVFYRLDLELVIADVRADNEASRRAFQKFVDRHGGAVDGVIRNEWVDDDGTVYDACRYSIARSEWQESRSESE
jgi:RimJ/RimL family protein N-acetyltransferase